MHPRATVRTGACCAVSIVVILVAGTPAIGAPKERITGKLSEGGYTVIALAHDGEANSVPAPRGRFKLKPPAKRSTLHLRATDGTYAGPIVVGKAKNGKRAILGVEAGAKLGKVKVKASEGYAKAKRPLDERSVDAKRRARAKNGVPIGADRLGRVRATDKGPKRGAPGDRDLDGIPELLDIDDDGDLILDGVDSASATLGTQTGQNTFLTTDLVAALHQTANANAGLTDVDAALSSQGQLFVGILNSQGVVDVFAEPDGEAELDCGKDDPQTPELEGLPYCRPGGTGTTSTAPGAIEPFPGAPGGPFDPDGDGFGTLTAQPPATAFMVMHHGATTAEIGSGDHLIQRVTTADGVEHEFHSVLPYVFATVPALKSFDDGQGAPTTISYPVSSPTAPGTGGNGFPVTAPAGEDVVLTITYWRPQREPIKGETGEWTDIGHLTYAAAPFGTGLYCPESSVSTTDLSLTPTPLPVLIGPVPGAVGGGFTDIADDQPADPDNTLTYTLNLTQCLEFWGLSFEPGEDQGFNFYGLPSIGSESSQQSVFFERQ